MQKYRIKRVVVFVYHLYTNKMIKCGHKPIVNALLKILDGVFTNWVWNLLAVLWANWSTVQLSAGFILYYIYCNSKPIFSIKLEVSTGQILPWNKIYTIANLLVIRARQLQRQDNHFEQAILFLQQMQLKRNNNHKKKHGIWIKKLALSKSKPSLAASYTCKWGPALFFWLSYI